MLRNVYVDSQSIMVSARAIGNAVGGDDALSAGNVYKVGVMETFLVFGMATVHKVKITVLKRFSPSEIFAESPVTLVRPMGACEQFKDGQEFIIDGEIPKGFCASAWASIYPNVRLLALGGNLPWFKEKGVALSPCIDGLRPVIFKLERI